MVRTYKFSDNQISFADLGQPVGMKMSTENRWVKKAESIPWKEIELRYAQLFTNRKGNVAKPLRLALGACIIQAEYGFADAETALMIQEHPYLQFFCGFSFTVLQAGQTTLTYTDKKGNTTQLTLTLEDAQTPLVQPEKNKRLPLGSGGNSTGLGWGYHHYCAGEAQKEPRQGKIETFHKRRKQKTPMRIA